MTSFAVLNLLILISCSAQDDAGSQWTRFRGSDGTGIQLNWNDPIVLDSTHIRWKTNLPGTGNSSPVVWGNKIFVTSADDEKNIGYAFAINERDGRIFWQKEFKLTDLRMHSDNKLATASPAVDESQVYFIWYARDKTKLTALAHDGSFKWEAEFSGIEGRHGGGNSLMLTDELVVFTREVEDFSSLKSSWLAVSKQTGETVWELERNSARANSFSTPFLLKSDHQANQLLFASQAHGLTGVDPEKGHVIWERKDLLPARVVASPVYSDGHIVACRKNGALVIDFNQSTNEPADTVGYSLPASISPYVPTPIVVGDLLFLFVDNGTVACVLLETGKLMWKERPAGPIYGSPVCISGNLYCITREGKVLVIRADSNYQLIGIHDLGEGSFSTPVMSNSGMLFRTFSQLISF